MKKNKQNLNSIKILYLFTFAFIFSLHIIVWYLNRKQIPVSIYIMTSCLIPYYISYVFITVIQIYNKIFKKHLHKNKYFHATRVKSFKIILWLYGVVIVSYIIFIILANNYAFYPYPIIKIEEAIMYALAWIIVLVVGVFMHEVSYMNAKLMLTDSISL